MTIYKFIDNQERLTKKNLVSWKEARKYAAENNLTCLNMPYKYFLDAFNTKVKRLDGHFNFSKLERMAIESIAANHGSGHPAIVANDFMHRIVEMPTPYIVDWLEGKNNLEWLPEYVRENECDCVVTYVRDVVKDTVVTAGLHHLLANGLLRIDIYQYNENNVAAFNDNIKYWSNSLGELHHHGEYDISEEELPAELQYVYCEYDIFERFGSRCYLVETNNGYGIALINEYDENFAQDCKLSMKDLFYSAMVDASNIRSHSEFEKASIFLGEHCGFNSCHELCVVFPADISQEDFQKAAHMLDQIAFTAAPEFMRAAALLNTNISVLDINSRTRSSLKKSAFSTVGELLSVSPEELIKLPEWGARMMSDIDQSVKRLAEERNVPNLQLWAQVAMVYLPDFLSMSHETGPYFAANPHTDSKEALTRTDYPYDFGTGYKIQTVFANKTAESIYGDIYDFHSDAAREHPNAEIISGYCVISEVTGMVANNCNDWNNTIADAMKDYEEHVVPVLERNEDIKLNSTELDPNGEPIRETLFSVKSGWLQDYLGVDNQAQLEALLVNSDEWDPSEILKDARNEPDLSGLIVGEVTEFSHNTVPPELTPYRIKITESYVKEVVVYGEDETSAEETAEHLCAEDEINIDFDHFANRSVESLGIARQSDLGCHDVFGAKESVPSNQKLRLDRMISSAEGKVNASGTKESPIPHSIDRSMV